MTRNPSIAWTLITAFFLTVSGHAQAQHKTSIPRIGVIMTGSPDTHARVVRELRRGLKELGYREGESIVILARYAMRKRARLPILAKELMASKVDVFVVTGSTAAKETRKVSPEIPIVVASARDLVASGIVNSLAKPGGNTTGNSSYSARLGPKQLQLLKDVMPGLKRVAVLYGIAGTSTHSIVKDWEKAGEALNIDIQKYGVRKKSEFGGVFSAMAKAHVDALILVVGRLTSVYRGELIKLAAEWKVPAMCWQPSMARKGCFMSYGSDRNAMYRNAANFVHRILKGAKPADLPVEQPTRYEFVMNLKAAKALGISVPPSVLLRADEVIE